VLDRALRGARRAGRADPAALAALRRVLLLRGPRDVGAVQQFQQLCVAVAAKGVEDTAMYAHVALASRNEVGAAPDAPLVRVPAALHAANAARARHWPAALLTVATHDTKRSADVRARLDVLSEIPAEWLRCVRRWRRWHRPYRRTVGGRAAPSVSAEYLLYQTMVAIWPPDAGARTTADLRARIAEYALKAVREAKRRTSWIRPDAVYEEAVAAFVRAVLAPDNRRFLDDLGALVARVAPAGMWNALARVLVQVTAPGVPDVYQGDELWNLALVDPDNRRPVEFGRRRRALASLRSARVEEVLGAPQDGRIKLLVLARALAARRRAPTLFAGGAYRPLAAGGGPAAGHLFVFARRAGRRWAITVVPRLTVSLGLDPELPPCGAVWGGVHVALPAELRGARLESVLTGERLRAPSRGPVRLSAAAVLGRLPVALLVGRGR
jgi:(1->4)-alpha-D-glucan 1-alpha-D-glucosylmutase